MNARLTCSKAALVLVCCLGSACRGAMETGPGQEDSTIAAEGNSTEAARPDKEIAGLSDLLRPGSLVMFGEMHGTNEAPAFVGRIARIASEQGHPVRVGLEVTKAMQAHADEYLNSAGTKQDVQQLISFPFWQGQDGRSSVGMLALFESIRELRQSGADVNAYLFDIPVMGAEGRDLSMAQNINERIEQEPEAIHLILTGNVHARLNDERWMGWHIKQRNPDVVSLNISYSGGDAWLHTSKGIGRTKLGGRDKGPDPFVLLEDGEENARFDGRYYLGAVSASEPVRPPAQ